MRKKKIGNGACDKDFDSYLMPGAREVDSMKCCWGSRKADKSPMTSDPTSGRTQLSSAPSSGSHV